MANNHDMEVLPQSESDSSDYNSEDYKPPSPKRARTLHPPQEEEVASDYDPGEHRLPVELTQENVVEEEFDEDSDLELPDDHVGFWRDEDKAALVAAINYYWKELKGNFEGSGGGKERRARSWIRVAEHINRRCGTNWTDKQCKGKAGKFATEVKAKSLALRRSRLRTGGGELDDDEHLSSVEQSMLDYVGVEGVIGIPGCSGVPLRPNTTMAAQKLRNESALKVWNYKREDRPNYKAALPSRRIQCATTKKGKGKGKKSKK